MTITQKISKSSKNYRVEAKSDSIAFLNEKYVLNGVIPHPYDRKPRTNYSFNLFQEGNLLKVNLKFPISLMGFSA